MNNTKPTEAEPLTGFVRLKRVLELIPVSSATWWRMVKDGKAPKAVKLSKNVTAWHEEDIKALIDKMRSGAVNNEDNDDE